MKKFPLKNLINPINPKTEMKHSRVRTSYAVLTGLVVSFFIAILAFLGGWTASAHFGNPSSDAFATTALNNRPGNEATPADLRDEFMVFWDVWNLVQEEFYRKEPLDQRKMVYGAIKGMLQSLEDDYTSFQEPEQAEKTRESMEGKFEGIGVYMGFEDRQITVERPIKGSPAMEAGLVADDVILKVDGAELATLLEGLNEGEAMDKAATLIRGPKGSTVNLTILRPAEERTFDVDIVRDEVPLISVYAQMLNDEVAYIQLTEFKATTTAEMDEALRTLLAQNPSSLVLDLRNNPGGFLTTAQEVLGRFYEGVALYEEDSQGNIIELTTIKAPSDTRVFDMPMIVLVNGNSASASEIVAGALAERRPNTTLLGEKSFGKGSVQNVHKLHDGSSARITIAHWLTPDKNEIHERGIVPDFVVPASDDPQYQVPCITDRDPPPDEQEQCNDAQLSWSLRLLTSSVISPAFS